MVDAENKEQKEECRCQDAGMDKWFVQQMKRVLLAGMGAAAMAQEEMDTFLKKLVEKGEIAEQDSKKWMKEFMEKGRKQTLDTVHNIEENSMEGLEKLLGRLNIPTKKDLENLSERVELLAKRVEELAKKEGGPTDNPPQN